MVENSQTGTNEIMVSLEMWLLLQQASKHKEPAEKNIWRVAMVTDRIT